ncbi:DUF4156 domain-containing protein [Orbaceae bacterium ESL0727]|nr:DUF4156 domain-containing protein [Orbaceae bacterium ESL0727]
MSIKKLLLISAAISTAFLLNACSNDKYKLTPAGQHVQFVDTKPADSCKFLGTAKGSRETLFSGTKTHSELIREAAVVLLNNAATMGGNVIYNAQDASMKYISEIAPTDAVMIGEVYKCN